MTKFLSTFRSRGSRQMLAAALALVAGAAVRAQTIVDDSGSARDGKVGYWSSLVAGGGDVAISYYCEDDHAGSPPEMYSLRFAWRTGSQWSWTTVQGGAGSHTTMRRDAGGQYQIAYDTWAGIGFAVGSGTSWATSLVDVDASTGPSNMSMTLDSRGRPHLGYMCYEASGAFAMRYTWWNGAQWVHGASETIRPNIWTPTIGFSNTWLQLDQADVPHVAFAQPSDSVNAWGPIRYGTLTNGVWTFEDLGVSGADPTLAIGPDNRPRMMFNSDAGITYAFRDASGWHLETAVPGEYASGAAMALSDSGQPYATFGMTGNEDQYLLRRDAGGWVLQRIDGDGTNNPHVILGRYGNSIDVDENGTPHLSYSRISYWYAKPGARDDTPPIQDRDLIVPPLPAWTVRAAGGAAGATIIEAENASPSPAASVKIIDDPAYSAGKLARFSATADLHIKAPAAGKHQITLTCASGPAKAAFTLKLDGKPLKLGDKERVELQTPSRERLVNLHFEPTDLAAGDHTLTLDTIEGTPGIDFIWLK